MSARTSYLRNLGPTVDAMLAEVGIATADELRRVGPAFAYKLLKLRYGRRVNRMYLYALEGALTDRRLGSFSDEEKEALNTSVADDLGVDYAARA